MTDPRPQRRRKAACWFGLAVLFSALAAAFPGIRDVNSGSHYALVRALGDGTPQIDRYFAYVEETDYAEHDGHYYSDKPPGTAALALPFYAVGRMIAGGEAESRRYVPTDREGPPRTAVPPVEEYVTNLLMALAGVAVLLLAYAVCRELGAGHRWAVVASVALFAGTMLWRYATAFFSHEMAAALLLAMMLFGLRALRRAASTDMVLLGLAGGVAIAVDYSMAVPLAAIASVALWKRREWRDAAFLAAGAVVPLALLAGYHAWAFGSPFKSSYAYKARAEFAFTHSLGGLYSGGFANFVRILADPAAGLVVWNPLLLLAPIGFVGVARRHRQRWRLALLLVTTVPLFLLQAKFLTWEGGRTNDARYSVVLLGPLLVGVAIWLGSDWRERWHRNAAIWGFAGLTVLGFLLQVARLVVSVGHGDRIGGGAPIRLDATFDLAGAIGQFAAAAFPSIRFFLPTMAASGLCGLVAWYVVMRNSVARGEPLG